MTVTSKHEAKAAEVVREMMSGDNPQKPIAHFIAAALAEVEAQTRREIIEWHQKNARLCLDASKDDPRLNADDRRRAFDAYRHHAASAAGLELKFINEQRAILASGDTKNAE